MKKLKINKHYLVRGRVKQRNSLHVVKLVALTPTLQAKSIDTSVTFTLASDDIIRRVYKLKEGVEYLCRDKSQVQVERNPYYPAASRYAFRTIGLQDALTKYGCYWFDNSVDGRDVIGKVKTKGEK